VRPIVQRAVTSDTIENDWESLRERAQTDDVIIAEPGKSQVAVVSVERYEQLVERERQEQFAIARREFEELAAIIGDRNSDLSPEEIEELGNRAVDEPANS
jgi:PHD/YefM family antitoxin component YafN of YafNO toxin-antitoxin module